MARSTQTKKQTYSHEQLIRLGMIFDATFGFRGTSTQSAILISMKSAEFTDWLAKEYGVGESRVEVSKRGNDFWGWYVSLEDRVQLIEILESQNPNPGEQSPYVHSMDFKARDLLRINIEKKIR